MSARLLGLVAVLASLALAASARADTILWNNYNSPASVGYANIDGSGGGALNLGTGTLDAPEGLAYDTVTNRLFSASTTSDKILAINLDGSGASSFTAPGAPFEEPRGPVVDPAARKIYWINIADDTISWANLDGSIGGVVGLGGFEVDAERLSLDPVASRLYWYDATVKSVVSASTAGGVVTPLNIAGASPAEGTNGIAVEPALGKVFWTNGGIGTVSWASLAGTGGGDLLAAPGSYNGAFGIAVDAGLGRVYWGNSFNGESRSSPLGFANLAGGGGLIAVPTAPVNGPQDPVVLKPPEATGAPALSRDSADRSALSCTSGSWSADAPGAFVYRAPRSFTYQWSLNGSALAGSTAATLGATKPGSYTCTVTAANQAGTASQTSDALQVEAAKTTLKTKKRVTVKAGGTATFVVKVNNQGDLKSKNIKLCAQLPKAAKGFLKPSKCKSLGKLNGKSKKSVKLKIKTLPSANGVYGVSFKLKGAAGKPAKAKIVVR